MYHTRTQAKRGIELTMSAVVIIIIVLATLILLIRFFTVGFSESVSSLSEIPEKLEEQGAEGVTRVTGRCPKLDDGTQLNWFLSGGCEEAPPGCTIGSFGSDAEAYNKCRKCASESIRLMKSRTGTSGDECECECV
ncbi:MAG: hypothetical protein ABH829_03955 [archaeon]